MSDWQRKLCDVLSDAYLEKTFEPMLKLTDTERNLICNYRNTERLCLRNKMQQVNVHERTVDKAA